METASQEQQVLEEIAYKKEREVLSLARRAEAAHESRALPFLTMKVVDNCPPRTFNSSPPGREGTATIPNWSGAVIKLSRTLSFDTGNPFHVSQSSNGYDSFSQVEGSQLDALFEDLDTTTNTSIPFSKECDDSGRGLGRDASSSQSRQVGQGIASLQKDAEQSGCSERQGDGVMGFRTANNKPVKVSAAAMTKAEAMLSDLDDTMFEYEPTGEEPSRQGASEGYDTHMASGRSGEKVDADVGSMASSSGEKREPSMGMFRTASNRPVTISKEGLARARRMMSDVLGEESEASTGRDVGGGVSGGEGMGSSVADGQGDAMMGFRTANNKPVKVSAAAMAKAEAMLSDLDDTMFEYEPTGEEPSRQGASEGDDTHMASGRSGEKVDADVGSMASSSGEKREPSMGMFRTASNRPVTISKEGLARARRMMSDVLGEESEASTGRDVGGGVSGGEGMGSSVADGQGDAMMGFRTANNKPVKVSAAAMAKAEAMLSDLDDTMFEYEPTGEEPSRQGASEGYDTHMASGRGGEKVDANVGSMASSSGERREPSMGMFRTASNRPVTISKEGLARARRMVSDVLGEESEASTGRDVGGGVSGGEGMGSSVADGQGDAMMGFRTANNKPVKVSAAAMAKAEAMLSDLDDTMFEYEPTGEEPSRQGASEGYDTHMASGRGGEKVDANVGSMASSSGEKREPSMGMFRTASNRPVTISKEGLARARRMMSDVLGEESEASTGRDVGGGVSGGEGMGSSVADGQGDAMMGFRTANNKPVKVSAAAMAKAEAMLSDLDDTMFEYEPTGEEPSRQGASEGYDTHMASGRSGEKVDANVGSMASSSGEKREPSMGMFRTASNRPVTISKEGLARARRMMSDVLGEESDASTGRGVGGGVSGGEGMGSSVADGQGDAMMGFRTANNKPVKVSAAAMAKAEAMLSDLDDTMFEYEPTGEEPSRQGASEGDDTHMASGRSGEKVDANVGSMASSSGERRDLNIAAVNNNPGILYTPIQSVSGEQSRTSLSTTLTTLPPPRMSFSPLPRRNLEDQFHERRLSLTTSQHRTVPNPMNPFFSLLNSPEQFEW